MSEPRPLPSRYYVVGDEIRVRVEVRHQFNVEEVRLMYQKDVHPGGTITLIGEPDSTEVVEPKGGQGPDVKLSTVVLVTLVDVDHAPGEYFPHRLVIRTASGQRNEQELDLEDESVSSASFVVLSEVQPPDVRLTLEGGS